MTNERFILCLVKSSHVFQSHNILRFLDSIEKGGESKWKWMPL